MLAEPGFGLTGIPLVGGDLRDKVEMARWAAWPDAGTDRRTGLSEPTGIARAEGEVAGRPADRAEAREIGVALTAAGGAVAATDLLEALLAR